MAERRALLLELARVAGVTTSYVDGLGVHREVSEESLVAVLAALGHEISGPDGAPGALRAELGRRDAELVPTCAVAWDGAELVVDLRSSPSDRADVTVEVTTESGERHEYRHSLDVLGVCADKSSESVVVRHLLLGRFNDGYHSVTVHSGARSARCEVIAAPTMSYVIPELARSWGVFAPLYALHTSTGCGTGTLAELAAFARWTKQRGGELVGTLPLLASYLDEPFDPSPYSPVSRLFWNELYLDVDAEIPADVAWARRDEPLVDYRAVMAARREVVERRAITAWEHEPTRARLEAIVSEEPELDVYARFRSETERQGMTWLHWESATGDLAERRGDAAWRYHVYAQLAMREGLTAVGADAAGLYLDLPVGVSRAGFDTWRNPASFMLGVSAGAPPDALFTAGQNWGLPPLYPDRARESGHRYFAACVRNHMAFARMLRIDHIMGLHRIFCVADGLAATDGAYVSYPAEEMYAVLCLESHRARCAIAGEDLGTVPDGIRPAMKRHGFRGLHVAQFGMPWDAEQGIESPPPGAVASLNTHDTPTFAGWLAGSEIDQRVELGLITTEEAVGERADRQRQVAAVHGALATGGAAAAAVVALYHALAASEADIVLVTLEDLWLEAKSQNVPGTCDEHPNWRHKARYTLDEIKEYPSAIETLRVVDEARRA